MMFRKDASCASTRAVSSSRLASISFSSISSSTFGAAMIAARKALEKSSFKEAYKIMFVYKLINNRYLF